MIDINCDLGEGTGNDPVIMPYITSVNIACGGHFGNKKTVEECLRLAIKNNVKCGAHPSYPDLKNFGRESISIEISPLLDSIKKQIHLFTSCCEDLKLSCNHIKFHGALYNDLNTNKELASVMVELLQDLNLHVPVFAPWESVFSEACQNNGIDVLYEVFADRNYNEDLSLVSRKELNAIVSLEEIKSHVLRMIDEGVVRSVSGVEVPIAVDTICIHGDGNHAIEVAKLVQEVVI
ncbi:5-oxoprolinase subunit PxpA [Reichenbachiella versicolor]|uniref:5-oxoprolinase subunit PxpA n=1 Tax=Reichenbachiella versicolor TaxID=1821036 RepID=UPI000D6E5920|nr:5-oxoprolinase subunit PxpA [Reichenbachiella versicolor]